MSGPRLLTPRLALEPPVPADLDDLAAMWADPAVHGRLFGRALTREEVWHRLLRYIGHWSVAGYGHWIVRNRASGDFVGEVGLMDSRRNTVPGFEGVPEVGWALIGRAQGHGYAREALGQLLGWADRRLARTVCIIDPANAASLRLADRLGYRQWASGLYHERPTLFFERPAR